MARALLTLLGGVAATLVVVVLLTGGRVMPRGFAWVAITIGAGAVVMTVVVRRAQRRDRLERLDERRDGQHLPAGRDPATDDLTDGSHRE